jgi:hypothetical protein
MPKATVDENGDLLLAKYEVGFASQRLSSPPAFYSAFLEEVY